MKISKLYSKKAKAVSKAVKVSNSASNIAVVKHEFRVISADEINNNRSNAYKYLAF